MSGISDEINLAPEQNLGDVEPEVTPIVEGEEPIVNDGDETPEVIETEEKEPTVKELMERLDSQGTQIEKANKRTQYLQRKLERANKVQAIEPAKPKPDADSFETNEEYIEAFTDWKVGEYARQNAETQTKLHTQEQYEDFQAVIDSGVEKYPDFNEVARKQPADGGPEITEPMAEALMECDNPVDVAYYLGKNVKESQRISRLSPIGQAREIGKIEARFDSGSIKVTPQKTTTKTITPSSPIVGKTVTDVSLETLSTKDFFAIRNKADGVG